MTSEDIVQIFSPRRVLLKRSVSATDLNLPGFAALNLRDTKSFSGNMDDIKSAPQKLMEKIKGNDDEIHFTDGIETKDIYNNDTIIVNREALFHGGKSYSINDIAFHWKKDCRMWLWKNAANTRKNKSVGDQIKAQLIKG
ncbi:uncharacterized protein LOC109540347 [Dendroctonus ponderosae]|uniref:Uncharacterized protein n=1 Tax=Dendroctonus ponderosae TaxID=77166 RepID=A0AAR5PTW5_DENPD|nr:uncharacterized protein LOC109540347 [Dendroctonus ponderosae]KAH1014246.1 hypothetical protein HUJ04_003110 [Dendroctonus ponderosae]KAH1023853.1 hypothetical protein HUJ05_003445 [Dendroctonus ponderosae]